MSKTEKDEMHKRDDMWAHSMIYNPKAHKWKHKEDEPMELVRPDNNLVLPLKGANNAQL